MAVAIYTVVLCVRDLDRGQCTAQHKQTDTKMNAATKNPYMMQLGFIAGGTVVYIIVVDINILIY